MPCEKMSERRLLAKLDHREKGGYSRHVEPVRVTPSKAPFARALVYVATPENDNYLGCAPLPMIADQVVKSVGPSGSNTEYVLQLAETLRSIGARGRSRLSFGSAGARAACNLDVTRKTPTTRRGRGSHGSLVMARRRSGRLFVDARPGR